MKKTDRRTHNSTPVAAKVLAREQRKKRGDTHLDKMLDEALKGTFPASDPLAIDKEAAKRG